MSTYKSSKAFIYFFMGILGIVLMGLFVVFVVGVSTVDRISLFVPVTISSLIYIVLLCTNYYSHYKKTGYFIGFLLIIYFLLIVFMQSLTSTTSGTCIEICSSTFDILGLFIFGYMPLTLASFIIVGGDFIDALIKSQVKESKI